MKAGVIVIKMFKCEHSILNFLTKKRGNVSGDCTPISDSDVEPPMLGFHLKH